MKLSNLVYEPVQELSELDRRMKLVADLGYDGIELTATHPLGFSIEELIALTEKHRLPVISLLTGWSYGAENLCLSSPDATIRTRAVERLSEYASHAARLNAVIVVGLMQGFRSDEPDEEIANERIAECLQRTCTAAADLGTTVVIEPVNHLQVGFNHSAAEVVTLMERVGSPALSYMLDTIPLNIEETGVIPTIREHGANVRHFHLCETNGGLFGSGALDFQRVLAALDHTGYDDYVSVKIYRQAPWAEAAKQAIDFLRRIGGR